AHEGRPDLEFRQLRVRDPRLRARLRPLQLQGDRTRRSGRRQDLLLRSLRTARGDTRPTRPRLTAVAQADTIAGMSTDHGRAWVACSCAVTEARAAGRPLVALESTIIAHGMPWPENVRTAREVEAIIRDLGAEPATIAVMAGP